MAKKKNVDVNKDIIIKAEKRRMHKRATMMRVMGISIISAAVLLVATKTLFNELFVGDDWSDVDWGENDEDFGVDID